MRPTAKPLGVIRALARLDPVGRVQLPAHIRRALQLKENQVIELKVIGSGRNRRLLVSRKVGPKGV